MKKYKHIYDRIVDKLEKHLNPKLVYHTLDHTVLVMGWAQELAERENVTDREFTLVQLAALFHDTGFLISREEHEMRSCEIARAELANEDLTHTELDTICGMIMATKIPQSPKNHLDRILVDSDLYYLGTDDYDKYSNLLFEEIKHFNPSFTQEKWKQVQIEFLETHQYSTDFAKNNLEPAKQEHLKRIKLS